MHQSNGSSRIKKVAIIGAGPSGATLGCLLRQSNIEVDIYDAGQRPELIVGESLIPAVVPLLQRLGVEAQVAEIGVEKPGASICLYPDGMEWKLDFSTVSESLANGSLPPPHQTARHFDQTGPIAKNVVANYAYNVPRADFDRILLDRAMELGCTVIPSKASLLADSTGETLFLEGATRQPDCIVDASGRSRYVAKRFALDSTRGERNDTALFAHFSTAHLPNPGYIHINILENGWSWRIPLPNRVSVGVVVPQETLSRYGNSASEQFDQLCAYDPVLAPHLRGAERLSRVAKYGNYQWISGKLHGKNWALAGDAAGFLDPTFSSGVFLALHSASLLADSLITHGLSRLPEYEHSLTTEFRQWQLLIDSFYQGGFFSLVRQAKALAATQERRPFGELHQAQKATAKLVCGYGFHDREIISTYQSYLKNCQSFSGKSLCGLPLGISKANSHRVF